MPRKTIYERDGWDEKLELIEGWARDGLTDEQIADNMGIHVSTLYEYKKKYPELSEALKKGKEVIDRQVENALLKRALGYEYQEVKRELKHNKETGKKEMMITEVKTKEVQPDTTAQIFWLKNRKPDEWRDKQQIDVTSKEEHISGMSKEEREERRKQLLKKLGDR
jgi:hypothetical protein